MLNLVQRRSFEKKLHFEAIANLVNWAFQVGNPRKQTLPSMGVDFSIGKELAQLLDFPTFETFDKSRFRANGRLYNFMRFIFVKNILHSPWGLTLLHHLYSSEEIQPGIFLSPPPKFLYPQNCMVLYCNKPLTQASTHKDLFLSTLPQTHCKLCSGTNNHWDKVKKKLLGAFALAFKSSESKSPTLEDLSNLWEGFQLAVGYLDTIEKPYIPRCAYYKEGEGLGEEFVKSLYMWPEGQKIIFGNTSDLHFFNDLDNKISNRPNFPSSLCDEESIRELKGKCIRLYQNALKHPVVGPDLLQRKPLSRKVLKKQPDAIALIHLDWQISVEI